MTETQTTSADLVAALDHLSRQFVEIGDRAETLDDAETWHHNAAQLRLVAHLARPAMFATAGPHDELAEMWLSAGRALLAAHEQALMDDVHASRASRRTEAKA